MSEWKSEIWLNENQKYDWMKIENVSEWKSEMWLNENWKYDWIKIENVTEWKLEIWLNGLITVRYMIISFARNDKYALIPDIVYISALEKELTYWIKSRKT